MEEKSKQTYFMEQALELANLSIKEEEVPVGAVVVDKDGEIIGRGYNKIEKLKSQSAHAEVLAIEEACKIRGDWRLDDCSIYVTLEPCLMCFGLIKLSRIKAVFFGAKSLLFGVDLDNEKAFSLYKKDLFVQGGIKAQESIDLLKEFFKKRRSNKKD